MPAECVVDDAVAGCFAQDVVCAVAVVGVEVEDAVFSDVTSVLERLRKRIHDELKSELGISAHIKLVEPRSIARSEGKAQRIIDRRSI